MLALAAGLCAGLIACGGGDGGGNNEDPKQVLDQTFSNDESIESGSIAARLEVEAVGGDDPGTLEIALEGRFQSAEGEFPSFDLSAEIGGDFSFSGGATSTGDAAYITYRDTAYEVPEGIFDRFARRYLRLERSGQDEGEEGSTLLRGLEPTNWLTDLRNEGTEEIEGAETIHVSGEADVPEFVEDLRLILERAGEASGALDADSLQEVSEIVNTAKLDVYTGVDDKLLRRLDATLELTPPEGATDAPDSLSAELSLTFSDVNQPQEIAAPEDPKQLDALLEQLEPGLGLLGPGSGDGSGASPSDQEAQEYFECLSQAEGAEALQECDELRPR